MSIDLATGSTTIHDGKQPNWKVHLVDTGLNTMTGGRLKRLSSWLEPDEDFMFTYGDGVADVDLRQLTRFHKEHGKLATVTTVRVPARFGRIHYSADQIEGFHEKPSSADGWISGGFFMLNAGVLPYIDGDDVSWEKEPIDRLVETGELMGYRHDRFWSCMDTLKERNMLESLWRRGDAPWRIWEGPAKEAFVRNQRDIETAQADEHAGDAGA